MRIDMHTFKVPTPELSPTDRALLQAGQIPPWRRVWSNGVDVTDQPITEWPAHAQLAYRNGWRPLVSLRGEFMDQ